MPAEDQHGPAQDTQSRVGSAGCCPGGKSARCALCGPDAETPEAGVCCLEDPFCQSLAKGAEGSTPMACAICGWALSWSRTHTPCYLRVCYLRVGYLRVGFELEQDSRQSVPRDAADERNGSGGRTPPEGRDAPGGTTDEAVPPRPVAASDATTRKRNRKIFGALLLGTLEVMPLEAPAFSLAPSPLRAAATVGTARLLPGFSIQ